MARILGKEIAVTIFEPKDFMKEGPGGCNRCGGIISELLVQMLAVEGINLPDTVVQKGINTYRLHTMHGSVTIETPNHEKSIATVYRGGGPKGLIGGHKQSFDHYLLQRAVQEGAVHETVRVEKVEWRGGRPVLYAQKSAIADADLVVGACGVNSSGPKIFEDLGFGYRQPRVITAAIAELGFDKETVAEHFCNAIHLFLLPEKNIKFAAMIPKGSYVTVCLLGSHIDAHTIDAFLSSPGVRRVLPEAASSEKHCQCLPKMNIGAPKKAFADRVVVCGDAGSTRLFKDGIGAAYFMGKAAAKTAVFEGVGAQHFAEGYLPVYNGITRDNLYGKFLYAVTDIFRKVPLFTKGMLKVVHKEQSDPAKRKILSSVLWDMFTGNERYKEIFPRAVNPRMNIDLLSECAAAIVRRDV